MNKPKCKGFRRHRWNENRVCERCKKVRNPKAGDKMFRPVKVENE